jgi:hypothetical protein
MLLLVLYVNISPLPTLSLSLMFISLSHVQLGKDDNESGQHMNMHLQLTRYHKYLSKFAIFLCISFRVLQTLGC